MVAPDPEGAWYTATIQGVPVVRGREETEEEAV